MNIKWVKDGNLRKDLQKFCISPKSLDELSSILCKHGVDLSQWSVGQAKGLLDLYEEIKLKESELFLLPKNKLRRFVRVAFVDIFYYSEDKKYKLVENYRLFADGRKRFAQLSRFSLFIHFWKV